MEVKDKEEIGGISGKCIPSRPWSNSYFSILSAHGTIVILVEIYR